MTIKKGSRKHWPPYKREWRGNPDRLKKKVTVARAEKFDQKHQARLQREDLS
jgi:hypothetical protein